MKLTSPEDLINTGFKRTLIHYQLGNFEDEDTDEIFVKDDLAVIIKYNKDNYPSGIAYSCPYKNITYERSWDYSNQELFEL